MTPRLLLYRSILVFINIATFTSCKDIIEPSIAKRTINTEAPGDKLQTTNYTVGFWWDDVENALQYHLQVVTPKFDSVASLVIDTVVKSTKFSINISPGNYQWRVRAENGSSKTEYSIAKNFTILQSSIKPQKVQLNSPANNLLTNQTNLSFSWGSLSGATRYHIQVDTASFTDTAKLFYNKTIPGQLISVALSRDQVYQWRVRAENDTAQSQWSSINYFTYDHTSPPATTLTAPADKQSVTTPVTLQWGNSATATKYRLYVYKSDGTTIYSSTFPTIVNGTTYSFVGVSGDTDYWKVVAIDAAGNESALSETRSFIIQ